MEERSSDEARAAGVPGLDGMRKEEPRRMIVPMLVIRARTPLRGEGEGVVGAGVGNGAEVDMIILCRQ